MFFWRQFQFATSDNYTHLLSSFYLVFWHCLNWRNVFLLFLLLVFSTEFKRKRSNAGVSSFLWMVFGSWVHAWDWSGKGDLKSINWTVYNIFWAFPFPYYPNMGPRMSHLYSRQWWVLYYQILFTTYNLAKICSSSSLKWKLVSHVNELLRGTGVFSLPIS